MFYLNKLLISWILNGIAVSLHLAYFGFSPDCNGKPFESEAYFFLAKKSDFRSYFLALEKKASLKKLGMKSGNSFKKKSYYCLKKNSHEISN
jgi:hypothetical protein